MVRDDSPTQKEEEKTLGNADVMIRDIEELQSLKRMREELDEAIEAAQDKI